MELYYINERLFDKFDKVIFSKEDIIEFVTDLTARLGLSEYLSDLNFDFKKPMTLARYDFYSRIFNISLDTIIEDANNLYAADDDDEKPLFYNTIIVLTLVHEIVHMIQYSQLDSKSGVYSLISKELHILQILEDYEYDQYYQYFSFEREALVSSYEVILYLLKVKFNNERMYEFFKQDLENILLFGYKIKKKKFLSPTQIINSRFSKRAYSLMSLEDVYESLKYGYPVTYDEYNEFKINKDEIICKKITCM